MLDYFDWRILSAIQKNGRLTNRELGEIVHLSTSQCSRRRVALEKKGIIRHYCARLDHASVGLSVMAFVQVNIRNHQAESFGTLRHLIQNDPMIQEAFSVSGDADYLLKIVAQTLESLSDFVTTKLLALDTVSHVKSYIALKQVKEISALPLHLHPSYKI